MNGSKTMLLLPFIRYSGPVCRKKHFSSQEKHQPLIALQLLPVFLVATLRSMEASLLPALSHKQWRRMSPLVFLALGATPLSSDPPT
jgi:hypothetical protein